MADIKTRDVVKGTIKKIDKAAIAADRMRSAYVQTKEKAEHTTHPDEHNAEEYASDRVEGGVDRITHEAAHQFDKQGRKGLEETKRNVSKAKDGVQKFREKRATESMKRQTVRTSGNKTIKAVEQTEKTIKQSARSAGKKTIKTAGKGAAKAAQRSVKTTKTAIKTTQQAAKTAQKTAQATVKASQKAAQAAKATAKAAVAGVKAAVKATIAAVKAIIAATKALVAAIAAGGWVAVAVIVVICLIALICGSVFGIFFSGEDSGTGMSMQTAVQEINADYDAKMEAEKNSVAYDNMEISGGRAVWKDVLAVYAVKTNTDKDNPQEVATMDESKKQILSDIFWEMNSISSRSESHSETEITETDDGNGNIVQTETTVTKTTLYITVSHLTVDEMADLYGFDAEQREYLAELLKDKNNSLWAAVLYGIRYSDDQIVTVALSQVGNVGGEPYWSWYGFGSRVEWCACFVSWCADQCGYIETGVPLGYLLDKKAQKLAIDPTTAPLVVEVFEKYADGKSVRSIVEDLNVRGLRTKKGQPFNINSFSSLLKNRKYIGEYRYQDVVIEGGVPAIVPEDLFNRVQERMEKNRHAPAMAKAKEDYLLTTKLFCGKCERMMVGESGKSHTGAMHYYYKCSGAKRLKDCDKKAVRKDWIERVVVRLTMQRVMDEEKINRLIDAILVMQEQEDTTTPALRSQLAETESSIGNILKAIEQGIFTPSTKQRLDELEARKEEILVNIQTAELQKPKLTREQMTAWFEQFRHGDPANRDFQKRLIDTFVNAVYVFDDKLVLTYNYQHGTQTISLDEIESALSSDFDGATPPKATKPQGRKPCGFVIPTGSYTPFTTSVHSF